MRPQHHDPLRLRYAGWMQENLVHEAENSRIRPDPERHDETGEDGKAFAPEQIAPGVPEIAESFIDIVRASHIAAFLLVLTDPPNRAERRFAGFILSHTRRNVLLNEVIKMKTKFFIKLALYRRAADERSQ